MLFAICALFAAHFLIVTALWACGNANETSSDRSSGSTTSSLTVIIPAFNEAERIETCLTSVLCAQKPPSRIIVVDDGSDDATQDVLADFFANLRVDHCVIRHEKNLGKAIALNTGLGYAVTKYVVLLDADTHVAPDCFAVALDTLETNQLDAVAFNVSVAEPKSFLTRLQAAEYALSLQVERAALASIDAISTLPGAGTLFRRSVLQGAAPFSTRTRCEDTDCTLHLQRDGLRLMVAPLARCWTLTPRTVRALFRQRRRWVWGNIQAAWFHSFSQGNSTRHFRLVILPIFLISAALAPFLLLFFLYLISGALSAGNLAALCTVGFMGFVLPLVRYMVARRKDQWHHCSFGMYYLSTLLLPLFNLAGYSTALSSELHARIRARGAKEISWH